MSLGQSPLELLYAALAHPLGIVVSTDNPQLLRQKLYAARRQAADPQLTSLTICPSRTIPQTELWIVRQVQQISEPA